MLYSQRSMHEAVMKINLDIIRDKDIGGEACPSLRVVTVIMPNHNSPTNSMRDVLKYVGA